MSITGIQLTIGTPAPAHNGTPTSKAAAEQIEPTAGTLRAQVLSYVRSCADHGATDEQIQLALEMNPSTQRPRRQELEKMGLIVRTTRTRPTKSGRSAVVFVAVAVPPTDKRGQA
jgi:hypothetical protein